MRRFSSSVAIAASGVSGATVSISRVMMSRA